MFNRLRNRYIAFVAGLIIAVALILSVAHLAGTRASLERLADVGSRAITEELARVVRERGESMIRLAAVALAEPLGDGDLSAVSAWVHDLRAQSGVDLAVVFDRNGAVVQAVEGYSSSTRALLDETAGVAAFDETERILVRQEDERMYFTRPIRHAGESVGSLMLALPLEDISSRAKVLSSEFESLAESGLATAIVAASLTTLGLLVVGVVLATVSAERLAAPLRQLAGTAARLAGGDYRCRTDVGRRDEIGEVQQALNYLGRDLEKRVVPRRFMENVIGSLHEGLLVIDGDDRLFMVNRTAQELFVTWGGHLQGRRFSELFPDKHRAAIENAFASVRRTGGSYTLEAECDGVDGRRIPVALSCSLLQNDGTDTLPGLVCITRNVSERRKAELQVRFLAQYDLLTGLPNRALFQDRLTHALARGERNQRMVGLILLNLDGFKLVNETLGRKVGDKLLLQVAERLRTKLRKGDTVARLADDEFIVVAELLKTAEDCSRLVEGLLAALNEPFLITGQELFITGSVGVTLYPLAGEDLHSLLGQTDVAMHQAKKRGKNRWCLYEHDMLLTGGKREELESKLHSAFQKRSFKLCYQPILDTAGLGVVAVEALLRWEHPEAGTVPPGDFLPVLENMGLMVPVGDWVLNTACGQVATWRRSGLPPVRMTVNLSERQFDEGDLAAEIIDILRRLGLPAASLELEITETVLIHNPRRVTRTLETLKDQGARLVIDDFGSSFSSFGYFQQLDVDAVKIDRSLVEQVSGNQDHYAIVRALIGTAHALDKQVVLEGVETEAQLEFAREQGVELVQGYRFGKPLSATEMQALLEAEMPA